MTVRDPEGAPESAARPASSERPTPPEDHPGDEVRPRLVVSRCLGFDAVRYDGRRLRSEFVEALGEHVEFVPLCPEVGIGLGVPRDPIRVVRNGVGRRLLIQPSTGRDLTGAMRAFVRGTLAKLESRGVDGFVLKSKSPSCAIRDAEIKAGTGEDSPTLGRGPGLFAEAVLETFPWAAVEDERRLTDPGLRHHFLTKLWAVARLRQVEATGEPGRLVRFHARHKLLLMAYHPERLRELGRIVAEAAAGTFEARVAAYRKLLGRTLDEPPKHGTVVNALHHAFGYVSEDLEEAERSSFLERVERFREGMVPLPEILGALRSWAVRFDEEYLAGQLLLEPYPAELAGLAVSERDTSLQESSK